jgi:hypothetical protein
MLVNGNACLVAIGILLISGTCSEAAFLGKLKNVSLGKMPVKIPGMRSSSAPASMPTGGGKGIFSKLGGLATKLPGFGSKIQQPADSPVVGIPFQPAQVQTAVPQYSASFVQNPIQPEPAQPTFASPMVQYSGQAVSQPMMPAPQSAVPQPMAQLNYPQSATPPQARSFLHSQVPQPFASQPLIMETPQLIYQQPAAQQPTAQQPAAQQPTVVYMT